jgi:hypothetical protein
MSNHKTWLRRYAVWLLPVVAILITLYPLRAQAADTGKDSGFNIQVSPSPLAVNLTPGKTQTATVTVRNLSNHSETLIPALNGFTMDRLSEKIELTNTIPLGLDKWITFKQSSITLAPGASQPLEIIYNTPKEAGFSHALAITLSPPDRQGSSGTNIQAKVAVFNLVNINRPDAKRELKIESFKSLKSRYEFLPAEFELTLKNNGNVIDQPTGNLFIQRSFDDTDPIATIPLNKGAAYILPDTSRKFASSWNEGFPHYVTEKTAGGNEETRRLSWDWKQLGSLRMGKYVAKVVIVYNDGQRDIPIVASYTFWVIPWRLIFFTVLIGGMLVTGLVVWGRMIFKGTKKVRKYASRK